MGISNDYDILQDFITEVSEILELLSEQLVELEQRPDDRELLNAIFRGFHTVKGGAGFLQLDPMVECCHVTENLFDVLRNGKRHVTPGLMDVVLLALDAINAQFEQVSAREELSPADPDLIKALTKLVNCEDLDNTDESNTTNQKKSAVQTEINSNDTESKDAASQLISDDDFEELLDAIDATKSNDTNSKKANTDEISEDEFTEDEFEALLDQLHGKKNSSGTLDNPTLDSEIKENDQKIEQKIISVSADLATIKTDSDSISDDEFQDLLDELHGKGNIPGSEKNTSVVTKQDEDKKTASTLNQSIKSSAPIVKSLTNVPTAETTVRVDIQRLDEIMNMVGELVLVRNRLVRLGADLADEALGKAVANLDVVTGDLQTSVMKTRMQPIKKVFGRFPRVVRDLSRSLKKEINLELKGEETDLDKNLVEALADPLIHLVRNAVDHGIEKPEAREAAGKNRIGQIVLAAEQEGDHILLSIKDDGAGMDPGALRAKAVEKGIYDEDAAARLSDKEAFELIFSPGFSTKTEISDVSGRGVGMDVVKTKITQLNGSIDITSVIGEGTLLKIKVPLTLAIMPTLMIMLEKQTFALPLASVNEIFHMDLSKSNIVDGQECVSIRNKAIPIFHLKRWLVNSYCDQPPLKSAHVVIVSVGIRRVGFVVDQLIGQEEVVIKPLGKMLQGTPGMAGATITGDGTIALILDVPSMLNKYAS